MNRKRLGKYVWTCDYCGKEFVAKKKCDLHESKCPRKNKKVLVKFSVSKTVLRLFWLILTGLLTYLFTFLIVNSYAKANGLTKRSITKPLEWFGLNSVKMVVTTPVPTIVDDQLIEYINKIRSSRDLSLLKKSDNLCRFTQERLDYLSEHEKEVAENTNVSLPGLNEMKKKYSGSRVGELFFGHIRNEDNAKSVIDSDVNADKFLLVTKKDSDVINVVCVKSKPGLNGFWVLIQLGSEYTAKTVSTKPQNNPTGAGEWGKAVQVDEHTWAMKIGEDSRMASQDEILQALNDYRRRLGSQILTLDSKLSSYAQTRADYFYSIKNLDGHKGFNNFLENEDGYNKLGYSWLGENASIGYRLNGVHLIEWIYAGDDPHNKNQLDGKWDHVGIGIKGTATSLIFGTGKR